MSGNFRGAVAGCLLVVTALGHALARLPIPVGAGPVSQQHEVGRDAANEPCDCAAPNDATEPGASAWSRRHRSGSNRAPHAIVLLVHRWAAWVWSRRRPRPPSLAPILWYACLAKARSQNSN